MKKYILFLLLFAVIAVSQSVFAETKQKAQDFTLKSIDGKFVKLSKFQGKVVLLNFWATWCPPCRQEMPSMQKLYEKMKNEKFQMISINIEKTSKENLAVFMKKNKYTFPVLMDPMDLVSSQYGIISIPTTFIIDKSGFIAKKIIGSFEWDDEGMVNELLRLSRAKK